MRGRVLLAVAGVMVVAAVVAVVLRAGGDDEPARADDPVEAFLAAYERSRTATFVVEQDYTRTTADGRSLTYPTRVVQRPPDDRLVVGGGNASGRLDGRVVRRSTSPDGTSRCDEGPEADPYDEEVAAEVAALRQLISGEAAPYQLLEGEGGCWSLHLRVAVETPTYGDRAGFCFDAATGAPTRFEVQRPEATDLTVAADIRTEVTASDLRPGELGELPGRD